MRCLGILWAMCALAAEPDFSRDVQPIFSKKCSGCHGAPRPMANLRLDTGTTVLRAVVPGDSANSPLIQRLTSAKPGFKMPPTGDPLSEAEVATIRTWIDSGAKAPRSTHWSFQPVNRPTIPKVQNAAWVRNPIDAFVLARLESEKIEPSPEAAKTTLLRRASLDLTGLPPSPAEIDRFLSDKSADAYERAVDRLLASPHYGEKWARHWLDLARYADSDGYEKDFGSPVCVALSAMGD